MLRAKFQDHRTSCSGEEDFLSFLPYMAWWSSWSCDLDHLSINFFPPLLRRLHVKFGFDWPSGFGGEDV